MLAVIELAVLHLLQKYIVIYIVKKDKMKQERQEAMSEPLCIMDAFIAHKKWFLVQKGQFSSPFQQSSPVINDSYSDTPY